MQVILQIDGSAAEYSSQKKQCHLRPPATCPHCGSGKSLRALGYYRRHVSGTAKTVLPIYVRRFRCVICRRTVSLLPSFAQPYRLVLNEVIQAVIANDAFNSTTQPWAPLIRQYWHRFCAFLPDLCCAVEGISSLSFVSDSPEKSWAMLLSWGGLLSAATRRLTNQARVTPFGRYRCHFPYHEKVHTPYMFPP